MDFSAFKPLGWLTVRGATRTFPRLFGPSFRARARHRRGGRVAEGAGLLNRYTG